VWVVLSDDWIKDLEEFSKLEAWIYLLSRQKKGIINTTIGLLGEQWKWHKMKVQRYLNMLQNKDIIDYNTTSAGIRIEIRNYSQYPTPSHQKTIQRTKFVPISMIKGKTPLKDYSTAENFAIWMYRNWIELYPDNKLIKDADLNKWSEYFRLMLDRDRRGKEDIREMLLFIKQDGFWKTNVLTPSGLRKKYDKIKPKYLAHLDTKKEKETSKIADGKWADNQITDKTIQ